MLNVALDAADVTRLTWQPDHLTRAYLEIGIAAQIMQRRLVHLEGVEALTWPRIYTDSVHVRHAVLLQHLDDLREF